MPREGPRQTAFRMTSPTESPHSAPESRMDSPAGGNTASVRHGIARLALALCVLFTCGIVGSSTAAASELDDYLWNSRPLLLFAPTDNDPRLVETLQRIEASRCDVVDRDMVIGVVVTKDNSTLDGQPIGADESQALKSRFAVGENTFTVLLIGKDGGEKLRVNEVPDLSAIYAVIDGMPMRNREASSGSSPC